MKTIYLIKGQTGEYDDYGDWEYKVFADKAVAERECERLNDILKKHKVHTDDYDRMYIVEHGDYSITKELRKSAEEELSKFDHMITIDYTGAHYYITELELVEEDK